MPITAAVILFFIVFNINTSNISTELTSDQLRLLRYSNIASKKYQTNFDIGIPSVHMFDVEVEKYAFMWKDAGQFSSKKYNLN